MRAIARLSGKACLAALLLIATYATLALLGALIPSDAPLSNTATPHRVTRTFYTTAGSYREVSARANWRGLTGDSAVMRMDVLGPLPADYPIKTLSLSDAQYSALLTAIRDSFDGKTPLPQNGFTTTDAFYPAKGRFHLARTCNVWIGTTIRNAGIPFGIWTPTPFSINLSHKRHIQ